MNTKLLIRDDNHATSRVIQLCSIICKSRNGVWAMEKLSKGMRLMAFTLPVAYIVIVLFLLLLSVWNYFRYGIYAVVVFTNVYLECWPEIFMTIGVLWFLLLALKHQFPEFFVRKEKYTADPAIYPIGTECPTNYRCWLIMGKASMRKCPRYKNCHAMREFRPDYVVKE